MRLSLLLLAFAASEAQFPLRYLGNVGRLSNLDLPKTINLDVATVRAHPDGDLRFEGKDRTGNPWQMWLEPTGLLTGITEAWSADFDHNGRTDLLIAARYASNGRCLDGVTLYTLLFDSSGKPTPWVGETYSGYGKRPALLTDLNKDGRAELITSHCTYSEPPRFGEDRRVTGAFEARNGRWVPLPASAAASSYLSTAKRQMGKLPIDTKWLSTPPRAVPDYLRGLENMAVVTIRSFKDGDSIAYSDGIPRTGWPAVVVDTHAGRRIYFSRQSEALQLLITQKLPVRLLGDNSSQPSLLWAIQK